MTEGLRCVRADNPGPFTLDGTRTYLVGRDRAAVIDPGPEVESHVDAVAAALAGATSVSLLITHGHGDHAGAVDALSGVLREAGVSVEVLSADRLDASRTTAEGEVQTDAGRLRAVRTPGHTSDHLAFLWDPGEPAPRSIFVGDLLLGRGDTTWVAEYPGCVADYLASLDLVEETGASVGYPTHGPPLTDLAAAVRRFRAHRLERIEQVRRAMRNHPDATAEAVMGEVYGEEVPDSLRGAAIRSLEALIEYVASHPEA